MTITKCWPTKSEMSIPNLVQLPTVPNQNPSRQVTYHVSPVLLQITTASSPLRCRAAPSGGSKFPHPNTAHHINSRFRNDDQYSRWLLAFSRSIQARYFGSGLGTENALAKVLSLRIIEDSEFQTLSFSNAVSLFCLGADLEFWTIGVVNTS